MTDSAMLFWICTPWSFPFLVWWYSISWPSLPSFLDIQQQLVQTLTISFLWDPGRSNPYGVNIATATDMEASDEADGDLRLLHSQQQWHVMLQGWAKDSSLS